MFAATTAGAGHFAGLQPFALACARAGHEVRVAAPASFAGAVADVGLDHLPLADAHPADLGAVFGRIPTLSMQEADDLVRVGRREVRPASACVRCRALR